MNCHHKRIRRRAIPAAIGTVILAVPASAHAGPLLNFSIAAIGLTDALHMGPDNSFRSNAILANAVGQVVGYSQRNVYDSWNAETNGSAWLFDWVQSIRIGLYDVEHTGVSGWQGSKPTLLNNAGQVVGYSYRFNGAGEFGDVERSSWIYSGGQTTRIGLIDADHTSASGFQGSYALSLAPGGQVAGHSNRYLVDQQVGQSAWLYKNGVTKRVGYFDPIHTGPASEQASTIVAQNDAGQAIGRSDRYLGADFGGQTAWMATLADQLQLGVVDASHTRSDGYRWSEPTEINQAGQVVGYSAVFSGMDDLGYDAWVFDSGVTTLVGFYDAVHTRADGYHESFASWITNTGVIVGNSQRYQAEEDGYSAWIHSGGTTTRIGLTDPEHTHLSGAQWSNVSQITDDEILLGESARYDGTHYVGMTAWFYLAGVTQRVGLTDAEHTAADGSRYSSISTVNPAGQAIGASGRYDGVADLGGSAWFHEAGTTTRIGLIDAQHTRDDGYRTFYEMQLNSSGQVVGTAQRYSGSSEVGTSGWFYDSNTTTTSPLIFSVATDGTARTSPNVLTEAGEVIGVYDKYSGSSLDGTFAFYWSTADGFHELGDFVDGGIGPGGWTSLNTVQGVVTDASGVRYVIGDGSRSDGSILGFVLPINGGGAWNNSAGGSWEAGASWAMADAPSFKDDAVFGLGSTYQVTLAADATAHNLIVSAGSLTLDLGGKRLLTSNGIQVGSSRLRLQDGMVRTAGVSVSAGGQIDLTNASMILDYDGVSPLTQIASLVAAGRNGGAWDGDGITSSLAGLNAALSVGVVDNGQLGLDEFQGEPVGASSLLLQITFAGDANLDGLVDLRDLYLVSLSWQSAGSWMNGDFDYSGVVDKSDLTMLARNWQAGVPLAAALESLGLPINAVPEPLMVSWAALAIGVGRRRRVA